MEKLDTFHTPLRYSLPPDPSALFALRRQLRTHLQLSPLDPRQIDHVILCVEEACSNSIRHSRTSASIDVELAFEHADLRVIVRDHGRGFDLSRVRPEVPPDPEAPDGRGLFLMTRLMDDIHLRVDDGVEVRMRKRGTGDPETPPYRLADLIDVSKLQDLLDALHDAFDCPSAIVDNEANVLTATGWQDICTRFHRVHPETLGECRQSDLYIYGHLRQGKETAIYVCPRGMIDCASPIIIDGRHLGNVFIGQVFLEPPDLESFRRQALRFGFEQESYLDAVKRVPVISRKELERRLPFLRALAEMVAELGLARLRERTARPAG